MHEFRTTVLPFFSKENLEQMGEWVINGTGKVKLYSVQQFNPEKCFDKKYEKLIPKPKEEIESLGELMKNYSQEVRVLGL